MRMDYKKIIPNQIVRFKILRMLRWIPDSIMVKIQYYLKLGRKLNLLTPERFTEKLQWYKLNYRVPLLTQCADKYHVREYVKSKGLEEILNTLYGVYESCQDINFKELPEKFVLKTTNSSNTNYFYNKSGKLDEKTLKEQISSWLNISSFEYGREWCYKDISPKIIIEKLLEDKENNFSGINDYKFLCFNGRARYIVLDVDRHVAHKRNFYDLDWKFIDVKSDYPNIGDTVEKPQSLKEMINISNILSTDFPFVRVDLYNLDSKIIFGELTFYPWTGYVQFDPDNFDLLLGKIFELPELSTLSK